MRSLLHSDSAEFYLAADRLSLSGSIGVKGLMLLYVMMNIFRSYAQKYWNLVMGRGFIRFVL